MKMNGSYRKILILLILFTLFSCSNNSIEINKNRSKTSEITKEIEDQNELNKKVSSNEFVYLFFNRNYFIKKTPVKEVKNIEQIRGEDYRVIIEWQVEGERFIRVKNLKTNKETVVKEGVKSGNIILIKRALDFYTFKIDNTIVKVKR